MTTQTIANPTVRYLRQSREWSTALPGGQEISSKSKAELEAAYLEAVAPERAEQARRIASLAPELADRARRAAFLVLSSAVELTPGQFTMHHSGKQTNVLAEVESSTGEGKYQITAYDGQIVCNCPDGNPELYDIPGNNGAPRHAVAAHCCKHIIAALMAQSE